MHDDNHLQAELKRFTRLKGVNVFENPWGVRRIQGVTPPSVPSFCVPSKTHALIHTMELGRIEAPAVVLGNDLEFFGSIVLAHEIGHLIGAFIENRLTGEKGTSFRGMALYSEEIVAWRFVFAVMQALDVKIQPWHRRRAKFALNTYRQRLRRIKGTTYDRAVSKLIDRTVRQRVKYFLETINREGKSCR